MRRPVIKVVGRVALRLSFLVVPFLAAGRADWGYGWLLVALCTVILAINLPVVYKLNPDVIKLRMQPVRPTKRFDKLFFAAGLVVYLCGVTVAGLDSGRYGWSRMSWEWTALGIGMYIAGMVPVTWSLAVNKFLATTVSIQSERGHSVVKTGPYRIVRHPMYSGLMLVYLSFPLILGSWWAFIFMGLIPPLLVFRTVKEDATLRSELAGYEEFTHQTPYRLIAGVW
ncbi:MAG: isoprenylcysteine carboxylmethyltransferase family protein [Acidobacteriales bacterium]|nr:isoprenylcysteine carboxylmethyltransferase family protein [Terriglobales bacterium]